MCTELAICLHLRFLAAVMCGQSDAVEFARESVCESMEITQNSQTCFVVLRLRQSLV